MTIVLTRERSGPYKFKALVPKGFTAVTVRFGRKGYSDYTIHGDPQRMRRYLSRHKKRENWTRAGRYTAGFWSRWILWSRPTFREALKKTEKIVGQNIIFSAK
jgi:hypothetical protein